MKRWIGSRSETGSWFQR